MRFSEALECLPAGERQPAAGLGYHGVRVSIDAGAAPWEATLFDEAVEISWEDRRVDLRRDSGRALERWTLATGRGIHPDLIEPLLSALGDPHASR